MLNQELPLAVRMRPCCIADMVGQSHVLGRGKILERAIRSKKVTSIILSGSAGCGKTTLGFIVAKEFGSDYEYVNAAFSSVASVKKILEASRNRMKKENKKTTLFIDEIHRFNKLQQESLVPDTEAGNIILVGATIYNPYYYLISSLISRSIIAEFNPLTKEEIIIILKKSLCDQERGLGKYDIQVTNKALEYIALCANGDARSALGALEIGALTIETNEKGKIIFDLEIAKECIKKKTFYDKNDSYHYDSISAFIKSIRGSDVDSALYWLAKMLKSGEDPRFIARRMVILASEDIGNANPFAFVLATNCFKAVEFVGMPEAKLNLAQTVIYLTASPKSNSAYLAIEKAFLDLGQEGTKEVPKHLKTHSKEYKYPHSFGGYVNQDYGVNKKYYSPKAIGEEKKIKEFLDNLEKV